MVVVVANLAACMRHSLNMTVDLAHLSPTGQNGSSSSAVRHHVAPSTCSQMPDTSGRNRLLYRRPAGRACQCAGDPVRPGLWGGAVRAAGAHATEGGNHHDHLLYTHCSVMAQGGGHPPALAPRASHCSPSWAIHGISDTRPGRVGVALSSSAVHTGPGKLTPSPSHPLEF
jgi:hypothetical protein